jgi:hypothetical protein
MVKKGLIAAGTLVTAFAATVGLALAQSPSPSSSPLVSPSPSASPSTTVPAGAPSTGHALK